MLRRADVEQALTSRCGALVAQAGLDGTTRDGTNLDCNDPIADALEELNLFPGSRSLVTDADVGSVALDQQRHFIALAELRYLQNGHRNLIYFDAAWVNASEKRDQLGKRLETAIATQIEHIRRRWGDTGSGFFVGPIGGPEVPPAPFPGHVLPVNPSREVDITRFIP